MHRGRVLADPLLSNQQLLGQQRGRRRRCGMTRLCLDVEQPLVDDSAAELDHARLHIAHRRDAVRRATRASAPACRPWRGRSLRARCAASEGVLDRVSAVAAANARARRHYAPAVARCHRAVQLARTESAREASVEKAATFGWGFRGTEFRDPQIAESGTSGPRKILKS